MIDLEIAPKREKPKANESAKTRYLVLGDFGGRSTEPLTLDRDNIDDVLARLDVKLAGLRMREVEDFHPDRLYRSLADFEDLAEPAPEPERASSSPKAALEDILKRGSILEEMVEGGDPFQRYVRELARAHAAPVKRDDSARVNALGERMRDLLHHPRFQAIEASWRGMDFVVRNMNDESSAIHIAQFSREELNKDLGGAPDLRKTRLFQLLTSRPWKAVFGLYSFASSAEDIELLGRIALLAAHAKSTFVAEGSVDMGDHFSELRAIPEARHLALALPRILLRLPYGAKASAIESFKFEEMPARPVHAHYLWGNPALAVLAVVARGDEEDLDLDHLPVHTYQEDGEWKMAPCGEVWLTQSQAEGLIEMGFIPVVSFRDQDRVRVAGIRSINGTSLRLIK